MSSYQWFDSKNLPYVNRKRSQLFENGSVDYEVEILKKDGTSLPIYTQMYSFQKDGSVYVIGTAFDISDRIKEIKEKEQMHRSLAVAQKTSALGTLSSGIAHDFNNILSGIQGYTELIRMAPDDLTNVKKGVGQILKGSERARELVQQILTFSRQAEVEKQVMKPYLVIKEAVKFMRSSIPASIEIKEKIISRSTIDADTTQVHQVVMNLCTNAYHAMRAGSGILTVELTDMEIEREDHIRGHAFIPGKYVYLKIADTGHGMNKKTVDRIFEPYFTTKSSGEGTGLGLAVVQGIIKEHHGHIHVESSIGQGTCFHLYFPVTEGKNKRDICSEPREKPEVIKEVKNVMAVDDETSILLYMQSIFEDYGYHVETFLNGSEALEKFSENPQFFDLVITDVAMPKLPGDLLAKEILKIREDIPIIVNTGYSETFDQETAYQAGVKKYFQKPVDIKVLLLAAQDLLSPS